MIFAYFELGAFPGVGALVLFLGYIREITFVIDEVGRPLLAPASFYFPVDGGDMTAQVVGNLPRAPPSFEVVLDLRPLPPL